MQKTVAAKGTENLAGGRQHRNPLSTPPHLNNADPVSTESTDHRAFLGGQNPGENKPARAANLRQDVDQQLTEKVRRYQIDSGRDLAISNVSGSKFHAPNFVSSGIALGGRNCGRIIVDSDDGTRAQTFCGKREHARAGPEIDHEPWRPCVSTLALIAISAKSLRGSPRRDWQIARRLPVRVNHQ